MSWDITMPIFLRNVIGDTSATPKYTDDQLLGLILSAAQFLQVVIPKTPYVIDVENLTLSPDPTEYPNQDDSFVYLATMKAATMLLLAEVRLYGSQAIAIRDGTSAIDLKRDLRSLRELALDYQKQLDVAIYNYRAGVAFGGRIIVSPFRPLLVNIERYYDYARR
jgi:hypothetical protein